MKGLDIDSQMDTSQPMAEMDKLQNKFKETQEAAGKAPETAKKSWKEFLPLIQSALPRSIQGVIRGFMSKERTLKQLGKTWKWFNTTLKANVFGILLIALEQIIANWDKIKDFFTGATYATKGLEEATKAATSAWTQFSAANLNAIEVIRNQESSIGELERAYKQLSESVTELKGVNLDTVHGMQQAEDIMNQHTLLIKEQAKARELQSQIEQYAASVTKEWYETEEAFQERYNEGLKTLNSELVRTQNNIFEAESVLQNYRDQQAKDADAKKKQEEEDRKAEQKRLKEAQEAEQRRLARIEMRRELSEELRKMELEGLDLDLYVLQLEKERELERAREIKAGQDIILKIEEKYNQLRLEAAQDYFDEWLAEEDARFQEEQADKEQKAKDALKATEQEIRDQQELMQALQDEDDPAVKQQREIEEVAAKYERLMALAEKYGADVTAFEEKLGQEVAAIQQKYREQSEIGLEAGLKAFEGGFRDMFNGLQDIAKDGSKASKALAVTEVLLNQAKAMSSAIAGATEAAAATGPGAPYVLAGYIATMIGTVLSTFASVKNILKKAGASSGGVGGQSGSAPSTTVQALVPTLPQQNPQISIPPIETFVVQSNLQGMNLSANIMNARSSL
jgi:hypothetical protein